MPVGLVFNQLQEILFRLVLFTGKKRAPGNGPPHFFVAGRQVFHLKIAFKGFIELVQLQQAVPDVEMVAQAIRIEFFGRLVIFKCLGRLFQVAVAKGYLFKVPQLVDFIQFCFQVTIKSRFKITRLLVAPGDFLIQLSVFLLFQQVTEYFSCFFKMVFGKIVLTDITQHRQVLF